MRITKKFLVLHLKYRNQENAKKEKWSRGLHPGVSWSPGDRMKPGDKNLMVSLGGKGGVTRSPGHN